MMIMVLSIAACANSAATVAVDESTTVPVSTNTVESPAAVLDGEAAAEIEEADSQDEFFTMTDHAKNEVTLPVKIERVVVDQVPIAGTYVMYKGGKSDNLIGLSASVLDAISKTALVKIAPDLLNVETGFNKDGELNIEELMKLDPDVVLYNAGNTKHYEMFKQAAIPAVGFNTAGGISSADPTQLYADWLRQLELVFREPGKMDDVIAYGDQAYRMVQDRIAQVPVDQRPDVMILFTYSDGNILVPGATGHFGGNWLKAVGVNNVAAELQGVQTVTMEQIYQWDPDVILMPGPGQIQINPLNLYHNDLEGVDFSSLTAVINKQVYTCDLGLWSWYTPNSDAPLVLQWMAKMIYPDTFQDIDLNKETREYYKNFYNYELSDEELDYIFNNGNINQ